MRLVFKVLCIIFGFLFAFALVRYARGYDPVFFTDFLEFLSDLDIFSSTTSEVMLRAVTSSITNFKLTLPSWLDWLGVVADAFGSIIGFLIWLVTCLFNVVTYVVYFIRFVFVA